MTPRTVEVRGLQVFRGDGASTRFAGVYCTARERSVTIDECLRCERCEGLSRDPSSGRSRVTCSSADAGPPEPISEAARGRAARERRPEVTPVSAVMAADVVAVEADLSVDALAGMLLDRRIGGVPVVDREGRPIGMVTKTDILARNRDRGDTTAVDGGRLPRGFHEEELASATVGEIMSPVVLAVPEGTSVAHAAALMAYEGVHRVPIVSESQRVVGLLTTMDVLRWLGRHSGYVIPDAQRT